MRSFSWGESKAGFLLNLQSTLDCQSHWLVSMFQLGWERDQSAEVGELISLEVRLARVAGGNAVGALVVHRAILRVRKVAFCCRAAEAHLWLRYHSLPMVNLPSILLSCHLILI